MRINISLSPPVKRLADQIIRRRSFDGLSDLLRTLIREEHERQKPNSPASGGAGSSPGKKALAESHLVEDVAHAVAADFQPGASPEPPTSPSGLRTGSNSRGRSKKRSA